MVFAKPLFHPWFGCLHTVVSQIFVKMLARSFIFLSLVLGTVYAEPYSCTNGYRPLDYTGKLRVPTSCKVEDLGCSPSWKSGIPEGSKTSTPMIYEKFLNCHEGFTLCGYVPIDPGSGKVLGHSGVTIGAGVDLGSKSRASLTSLPSRLVDKLEPYVGLKQNLAVCAAIERPLRLTLAEANTLTYAVRKDVVNEVSESYDSEKEENELAFALLPRGIRTAIVSVWYQLGTPRKFSRFWSFVKKNDWNNAIKQLRNFYQNPKKQAVGDLIRRNTLFSCSMSLEVLKAKTFKKVSIL